MRLLQARPVMLVATALALAAAVSAQSVKVDEALASYAPVEGVSGNIKSVGSDSMNNLMTLWAEGFATFYPNVTIEIEGKGSSTAPPALVSGQATFGPMSRDMKEAEQDQFKAKFGHPCVMLPTSIDMLAVFVHKDNPLAGLSLAQVDAIFGKTRKLGHSEDIVTWGDLGLTGDWASQPISLYGRNAASGTYGYFKEHALGKGDYKDGVKEQPGTSSVVQGVASDKYAIGYGGIGYLTADVRAVPLAPGSTTEYVPAGVEHAYSGDYPLARYLFLAVNYKPGTDLDPLRREFLRYVFSKPGQETVVKDGYFPLPARIAAEALASVGIR